MTTEPAPTRWNMPDPAHAEAGEDLVAVGADLAPGTLLTAYRLGLFPMGVADAGPLGWWSPDPRGILPLDRLRAPRSLRRSAAALTVTVDTAFDEVVAGCADPARPHGWITGEFAEAYAELHRLGWAHSVETRTRAGDLVGGLYGVEVGGLFAGESMFHRARDASKAALLGLVRLLRGEPPPGGEAPVGAGPAAAGPVGVPDRSPEAPDAARLLDVQWLTPHLASLGAVDVPRREYLDLLAAALPLRPRLSR